MWPSNSEFIPDLIYRLNTCSGPGPVFAFQIPAGRWSEAATKQLVQWQNVKFVQLSVSLPVEAALIWVSDDISGGVSVILVMQQALALDGVTSSFHSAGFTQESRSLRLYVLVFAYVSHADEEEEAGGRSLSSKMGHGFCWQKASRVFLDVIVAVGVFMTVNWNLSLVLHLEEIDHKGAIQTFSFSVKLPCVCNELANWLIASTCSCLALKLCHPQTSPGSCNQAFCKFCD